MRLACWRPTRLLQVLGATPLHTQRAQEGSLNSANPLCSNAGQNRSERPYFLASWLSSCATSEVLKP